MKRLSIFWRLTLGSLAIIAVLAGVTLYAVVELRHLTAASEALVVSDYPAVENAKHLLSVLYNQLRSEKKYLAVGDVRFVMEFDQEAEDFRDGLASLLAGERVAEAQPLLRQAQRDYTEYLDLAHAMMARRDTEATGPPAEYETQRDALMSSVAGALQGYIALHEARVTALAADSRERSQRAETATRHLLTLAILLGIALAGLATWGILRPLRRLQQHMRTIGQGRFGTRFDLPVPSELRELVDTVNAMSHQLQELDTMKAEFMQHLTHDLRTPLTSIRMGSQLLLEEHSAVLTAGQRETLEIIQDSSQRLIQSVSNLLDLSKADAGLLSYHIVPTDLKQLGETTIKKMRFLAEVKQIAVRFETPQGALTAPVDTVRMEQVFDNLLSNALKFTPMNGTVTVRIESDARAGGVRVTVSDNGPGIPTDELPRIFDRFYQGQRRTGVGSGLGLALVKKVIEAHGGRVTVRSQPERGTTFELFLPVGLRAVGAAS
jgi:two-component system, NtrC family, sensor histidine kinase GlrK